MTNEETIDKMMQLKLPHMAQAFREQLDPGSRQHAAPSRSASALMVDREWTRAREPPHRAPHQGRQARHAGLPGGPVVRPGPRPRQGHVRGRLAPASGSAPSRT